MSVLSLFYGWALAEDYAQAEPFTYRMARALFAGTGRTARVNLAVRRTPKPHVTIRYLEPDFTSLFLNGLRGLAPDGGPDPHYRGRELARNAAIGELALATGMRTLEYLVSGHYRQAAEVAQATDHGKGPDAALVLYLTKADPLLVLRDLLGHSTVLTTEKYLRKLDTTRIYREAYEHSGLGGAQAGDAGAQREADAEFAGDPDGSEG